jgi:hypothetical protein
MTRINVNITVIFYLYSWFQMSTMFADSTSDDGYTQEHRTFIDDLDKRGKEKVGHVWPINLKKTRTHCKSRFTLTFHRRVELSEFGLDGNIVAHALLLCTRDTHRCANEYEVNVCYCPSGFCKGL